MTQKLVEILTSDFPVHKFFAYYHCSLRLLPLPVNDY